MTVINIQWHVAISLIVYSLWSHVMSHGSPMRHVKIWKQLCTVFSIEKKVLVLMPDPSNCFICKLIIGKRFTKNFSEKTAEKRRLKFDIYLKVNVNVCRVWFCLLFIYLGGCCFSCEPLWSSIMLVREHIPVTVILFVWYGDCKYVYKI